MSSICKSILTKKRALESRLDVMLLRRAKERNKFKANYIDKDISYIEIKLSKL